MQNSRRVAVRPYSIKALINTLNKLSKSDQSSPSTIKNKFHLKYLSDYFSNSTGVGAKTIVIEKEYVDRDFLIDHAEYYVKCFKSYSIKCSRIHFFNSHFTKQKLEKLLNHNRKIAPATNWLQKAYLGFIVVKPLPETIIGRTCLKTYPKNAPNGRKRNFVTARYNINLYGIPLYIDSIAFQEQDNVAAVCATSALWTLFQKTGQIFHHQSPAPVIITKEATSLAPDNTRHLPNAGLTITQMAQAIRGVGLEPFLISAEDESIFKSALYAYLHLGIPILLNIDLLDANYDGKNVVSNENNEEERDFHAVVITGYCLDPKRHIENNQNSFILKAQRISKIYVHDDQIGPFARMECDGKKILIYSSKEEDNGTKSYESYFSLSTAWPYVREKMDCVRALTIALLVPLYHKIRIPFSVIHSAVYSFDSYIKYIDDKFSLNQFANGELEWDVYLTDVNRLKNNLLNSKGIPGNYRKLILLEHMPRFIWRASAIYKNKLVLDLLFDATDIEQGSTFIRGIEYDKNISYLFHALIPVFQKEIEEDNQVWGIAEWFNKTNSPY